MAQTDRFYAEDNHKLIQYLKNRGIVKTPIVLETMCLVDRKPYIDNFKLSNNAYIDAPQSIGHGRTISAPHIHGVVFEILAEKLITAKNVLCIRCSAGYVSSCMALMMRLYAGTVFHIESIPDLKEEVKKTIEKANPYLLSSNRIQLLNVENESAGYPQPKIRYDVIYVGAAAAEIPQALIDQLAFGGRLVMPIGPKDEGQKLMQIDKTLDGKIEKRSITTVRYGYLDGPREITKENNAPTIRAENRSNEKSTSNGCMKDGFTQTTEKFETKTDETDAQPSIKEPEGNLQKLESKDEPQNARKTEDIQLQKVSNLELNSESKPVIDENVERKTIMIKSPLTYCMHKRLEDMFKRLKKDIVEQKLQAINVSKQVKMMREENKLLSNQIEELNEGGQTVRKVIDQTKQIKLLVENNTKIVDILIQHMDRENFKNKIRLAESENNHVLKTKLNDKVIALEECVDKKIMNIADLSKQLKMIEEKSELLSKQIRELNKKKQEPMCTVRNYKLIEYIWFFVIGVLAIIMFDVYRAIIKKLLFKD